MEKYYDLYIDDCLKAINSVEITSGKDQISKDEMLNLLADKIDDVKNNDKKIFFCGNGASCTMAEHMSADFFKNAKINTETSSETSYLTAVTNDLGGEHIFSHRIERVGEKGDMLVAISSSGNSPNIVNAINVAKEKGIFVMTLTGIKDDNKSRKLGDINIYLDLPTYGLVEAVHPLILHMILDYYLDKKQGGRL